MAEDNNENNIEVFESKDIEENKVIAGLAYFIFFLPLIVCPSSKFGKFHSNQGLILLITCVGGNIALSILAGIFGYFSFVLGIMLYLLTLILGITVFVFCILGLVNALNGKAKELPMIGKYRILK